MPILKGLTSCVRSSSSPICPSAIVPSRIIIKRSFNQRGRLIRFNGSGELLLLSDISLCRRIPRTLQKCCQLSIVGLTYVDMEDEASNPSRWASQINIGGKSFVVSFTFHVLKQASPHCLRKGHRIGDVDHVFKKGF